MTTKKIELDIMFTPYTIDTYATFTSDMYEEQEIENQRELLEDDTLDYDSFDWTYDHKKLVEILATNWEQFMRDNILDDVIKNVTLDGEPWSPREYNFSTDNCNVVFEIEIEKLEQYIADNRERYNTEKLESCDGFMWFGDEYQTMLNWYLRDKSTGDYSTESYMYDQYDDLSGNGQWDEVISFELVSKNK